MAVSSLRKTLIKPNPNLISQFHQLTFFSSSSSSSLSPQFPSFRDAKSAIIAESNPNKLAELFISQSLTYPCFTRHRPIYDLTIRRLSRANRSDLIERILEEHLKKISPISEGFFTRIIMLYSNAGMIDHALRTFYDLGTKFNGSEKPLCAILTALLNNSKFDQFHEVFDNVEKKVSISPGVKAFNLRLRAYCEENKVDLAKELLMEKMEKIAGVKPDIHCYNVMLGAYLKSHDWAGFDAIVKEVKGRGLEYNVTTYNHRIARLCKDKECARAKKLLDEMVGKSTKPNVACYSNIIYGYCKVGDLESAKVVLDRMAKDGYIAPISSPYYTLLKHMVREGEFESALDVCKEILKRRWVPPFEATEGLVKGLVGMSKKEEASQMIGKMKKKLQGPALDSWGKIEAALAL